MQPMSHTENESCGSSPLSATLRCNTNEASPQTAKLDS
jgi:hypothetical protein